MSQPHKFRFYATLLDAFYGYLNCDVIFQTYWGWSENPPHTEDKFREKKFSELIDTINRVPFQSEAADRGTAFNEVIDCMIEMRQSDKMKITKTSEPDQNGVEKVIAIKAIYKEQVFVFPISLCREFANYFKDALTQQWVEAILPTRYGNVLLCGWIDELMPNSCHDIKSTGKYNAFKFKHHFQHLVYPYCLIQNGNNVTDFEYNVTDFKETFTENYVFVPDRDIPILTDHCEKFIEFLLENKELITDNKIFGNDIQPQ